MSKITAFKLIVFLLFTAAFFVSPNPSDAAIVNTTINTDQISLTPPFAMVGSDNLPRIVYHTTAAQLIYVQCRDQSCSTSNRTVLPTGSGAIVNGNIAAFKETGSLIQTFYVNRDGNNYTIRQITCTLAAVDSCALAVDRYTIAAATPNPIIGVNQFVASRDSSNRPRLLLSWNNNAAAAPTQRLDIFNCSANCTTPDRQTLISSTVAGTFWKGLSLAVSSGNFALLTYWEVTSSSAATLRFYQCNVTGSCTSTTKPVSSPIILETLSGASLAVGLTSITTTSGGFPAIAYSWKPSTPPNTNVAICGNLDCSSRNIYSTLDNDSNPKIIRLPSDNLRIFSTRNVISTSLKLIRCNATCSGAWPAEVNVESNNADWSGAFVGSDNSPRVVYNANPAGAGIVLRMGCDLEGGSACLPSFTITANVPTTVSAEQGTDASYSFTVTSINGYTCVDPCKINLSVISLPSNTTAAFSVPYVNLPTAGSTQSFTMILSPGLLPATAVGSYSTIRVQGVAGALTIPSNPVTLNVTLAVPKPWIQTTGSNVGSEGDGIDSITFSNSSPASNATGMVLGNFAINNFTSAKNWLFENYNPIETGITGTYYDYYWEKFGSGKATTWTPPGGCSTIVNGFTNPGCVLIARRVGAINIPDFPDSGSFVYNGDITYNIDTPFNPSGSTNGDPNRAGGQYCQTSPCAGENLALSGNPTVFFVNGYLKINKDIITQGGKKIIFVVKGGTNGTQDAVEIDPWVKRVDAYIITSGKFNSGKWLNANNGTRYSDMLAIENQIKLYRAAKGYYPDTIGDTYDTSDGCSINTGALGDWWYNPSGLSPLGGNNWDGKTGGTNNINNPCTTTQGLRYQLSQSFTGFTGVDLNTGVGLIAPARAVVDPINGVLSGSYNPSRLCTSMGTPLGCIWRPKKFAYRYAAIEAGVAVAGQPQAYDLFATFEDDGNIDPYRDIPDPREVHLCGGVYNNDTSWLNSGGDANPRTWNGGDYCHLQNLVVNGGVVAQGGFDLSLRDLRDDNNSSYNGISPSGKGNPHPPTPVRTK